MSDPQRGTFVALAPLSSAFVRRFNAAVEAAPGTEPAPETADDAYHRGLADGLAAAEAARDDLIAACDRIADAVRAFDAPPPPAAAAVLGAALTALVRQIVGDAPVDGDLLVQRCREALALVSDAAGPVQLLLSPADQTHVGALIADQHPDLRIQSDAHLAPGSVRLEHDGGAVVHGPAALIDDLVQRWQGQRA
jgi:flagellar biosynthesis/type III secretory pathway protein FliH